MRPHVSLLAFPILAALATPAVPEARGCLPAPDYTMEILVDGRPLPVLAGNGARYVEATNGREYSIRLTNRTSRRSAVALSVDGLNAIDAKHTSARAARKWILEPWESITLEGWQVSAETARRFVFTTEEASYGAWLSRTNSLGVISAAFFRERAVPPPPPAPITGHLDAAPRSEPQESAELRKEKDYAATGMGRRVGHRVVQVPFDAEAAPASVVTFRYEFREALVRLGVLPRGDDAPLARRERARGFADTGFAPEM